MRTLALTRLKNLRKLAEGQIDEELAKAKPEDLTKPEIQAEIDPGNIYYILEEVQELYIGRIHRRYSFDEALKVR